MSLGLDLGISRFRSLQRQQGRLLARQTATAYVALPNRPAQQKLVADARLCCWKTDDSLLIVGADAPLAAEAWQTPLIPLLPNARLPSDDPVGRQVAAQLLESVAGRSSDDRQNCTVVLPRDAGAGDPDAEFFLRLLRLRGGDLQTIPAGLAVALSELGREQFTGIGVSFGAGGVSICLVERGSVRATAVTDRGGDWIDRQLAERQGHVLWDAEGRRYLNLLAVAHWKSSPERSLAGPLNEGERWLRQLYGEALKAALREFRNAVTHEGCNGAFRQPLTVVLHGGCTAMAGFHSVWTEHWAEAGIDLPVRTPRRTEDDVWTVARGCLIHAEVASSAQSLRATA